MTDTRPEPKARSIPKPVARLLYAGFLALALYQALIVHDLGWAAATAGIGLIFDPFDPQTAWARRPFWQRAWLIVHLGLMTALFAAAFFWPGVEVRFGLPVRP